MGLPRFGRPKGVDMQGKLSPNLFVANCGPAVGLSHDTIASVFAAFGEVNGVFAADESGARVIVSYCDESSARAALEALDGHPCPELGGRTLHIRYSVLQPTAPDQINDSVPVSLVASDLNIPGLYLVHDFVSTKEEEELLASIDERPWKSLAKRRVQHYGYEFCYETRNVNTRQHLGELPSFVSPILEKISLFPDLDNAARPCIMEFRRYTDGDWLNHNTKTQTPENGSNFLRRAIYLPPRSMLLLSGEARYAWHHYIPHHKIDLVKDSVIRRGSRRVSFTFRKVRADPCPCDFTQYCDSQR
ncbi:alkylated DNA repair protein ALKBH8 homolog isoform X2 [Castanea sativa]|uniref:alkylated DNA repair protein ALKBH8 homolog isoform X2 n=1 Tax=Castanea sativa TaxID=21020 RepID=UPI003F652B29